MSLTYNSEDYLTGGLVVEKEYIYREYIGVTLITLPYPLPTTTRLLNLPKLRCTILSPES